MREHDYKFYSTLRASNISLNHVPKSVRNSLYFQNLLDAKIIDTEKSGRGSKVIIKNPQSFELFFTKHFSTDEVANITKASNIRKLRDSKARKTKATSIFFIRGFQPIKLNDENIDLVYFTETFGLFSLKEPSFSCERICFVENLDSFLKADRLFGKDFIYIHKYGRIGIESLKNISAKEVIVFVDYDFNGLDEYLRIKSVFNNATIYIPGDFNTLFENYSKLITGKQKQSQRIIESKLPEVIMIRELVSRTNRFLEQEILIHD
jgi:hypothetical protein